MQDPVALGSSLLAFIVTGVLSAWCLARAARSAHTVLLALLIACFAVWNGFDFLWYRHQVRTYEHLAFIGTTLAPTLAFHYAFVLAGRPRYGLWALTAVYSGTTLFLACDIGGLFSRALEDAFWSKEYNAVFAGFFAPVGIAAMIMLAWYRRKAREESVRSLFTYPLAAGLIMIPLGFLELAIPWGFKIPRTSSLGCLAGSIILVVGVYRHRAVYDALSLLRHDAASVLRATVQGVIYLDPDGRVIFSNSVAKDLLGAEPRTLAEAGLDLPASGRAVLRRGGRVIELRVVKSAEVFPQGRACLILQDKTRDYEMMQALAAKEALASLGQAAATLAHEIRNPLTAIKSSIDCITGDLAAGRKPEEKHVEIAHSEISRLSDLLERSLELGRPLEVRREPCDLNALLRKMVGRMPVDGGRISADLSEGLPPVSADPDLLAQLFANLLKNAAEASRDVRVSTSRTDGGVSVRVLSRGARIPEEVLPRLFEPFVSSKPRGTGLGLALSRKIATAHGAEITGRNADEGADFEVRFPL